jgi:predicted dehydrogenase
VTGPSFPLRFAIVGAGGISRAHRAAFEARPELARLVAVCDARIELATEFAAQLPEQPEIVGDYRQLLDPAKIDAAIVALPHWLHFPIARDFVEAGIPVLVEKPLTCTLDEARQLRDLSDKHGVPVVAGQMRRFNREAAWLQRWLKRTPEEFGELRTFDMQSWQDLRAYLYGPLKLAPGSDHWLLDGKRAGGGVVISLAVHQLDLLRFVTGQDYAEVYATGRYDAPFYNDAESSAVVHLKLSNGASGSLHANYLTARTPLHEAMYLFGENGMIAQQADQIPQYHGPFRFATSRGALPASWDDQHEGIGLVPEEEISDLDPNPFINQLAAFATALHERCVPANNVRENFNTLACIDAVHRSLKSGRPEVVETI